ncbi:hypothetical protein Bca4012_019041 [Brassica carinata]
MTDVPLDPLFRRARIPAEQTRGYESKEETRATVLNEAQAACHNRIDEIERLVTRLQIRSEVQAIINQRAQMAYQTPLNAHPRPLGRAVRLNRTNPACAIHRKKCTHPSGRLPTPRKEQPKPRNTRPRKRTNTLLHRRMTACTPFFASSQQRQFLAAKTVLQTAKRSRARCAKRLNMAIRGDRAWFQRERGTTIPATTTEQRHGGEAPDAYRSTPAEKMVAE